MFSETNSKSFYKDMFFFYVYFGKTNFYRNIYIVKCVKKLDLNKNFLQKKFMMIKFN